MDDGYFASAPAVPAAPAGTGSAPSRRAGLVLGCVVLLGAATVAATAVLADRATERVPLRPLRAVTEPAPAAQGWAPSFVDAAGRPARWDPCAPIRVAVRAAHLPPTGRTDLAEALRRISAASGLQFVDEGLTDEVPSAQREAYQPERYGERWAPLLVGWALPQEVGHRVGKGVAGLASVVALPVPDGGSIVTAQVVLDASRRLASGFGPGATQGEVLLHELAHAIGLGHVDDQTQVMNPAATSGESAFGSGDRAGLAALGSAAGCQPPPAPRRLDVTPRAR